MIKKNKANVKRFIISYYTIKDTKRHIVLIGLVNTINK